MTKLASVRQVESMINKYENFSRILLGLPILCCVAHFYHSCKIT